MRVIIILIIIIIFENPSNINDDGDHKILTDNLSFNFNLDFKCFTIHIHKSKKSMSDEFNSLQSTELYDSITINAHHWRAIPSSLTFSQSPELLSSS